MPEKPFDQWMKEVDTAVSATAFLSADDLTDQPYYEWWESGMSPAEAAREALAENDYPDELLYEDGEWSDDLMDDW